MKLRLGTVVINCNDLDRMAEFWSAVLGYRPGTLMEDGHFVVLRDPEKKISVSLQKVRGGKIGRNQMHLDLYALDEEAEADRIVALGATRIRKNEDPADTYVVLEDPEGNQFCVCRHQPADPSVA